MIDRILYNPFESDPFLGCDYCGADEDDLIETADGFLFCSHCGFTQETAIKFLKNPCCSLFVREEKQESDSPWDAPNFTVQYPW